MGFLIAVCLVWTEGELPPISRRAWHKPLGRIRAKRPTDCLIAHDEPFIRFIHRPQILNNTIKWHDGQTVWRKKMCSFITMSKKTQNKNSLKYIFTLRDKKKTTVNLQPQISSPCHLLLIWQDSCRRHRDHRRFGEDFQFCTRVTTEKIIVMTIQRTTSSEANPWVKDKPDGIQHYHYPPGKYQYRALSLYI